MKISGSKRTKLFVFSSKTLLKHPYLRRTHTVKPPRSFGRLYKKCMETLPTCTESLKWKAINDLNQEDMEFKQHFGKFRSLWVELEMLRPSSIDPMVLNERREQDKVFGLLLTSNSSYNGLIKDILGADKLPCLEEVCSQVQKEEGSFGLFGGKGELVTTKKGERTTANKGAYKYDNNKKGSSNSQNS